MRNRLSQYLVFLVSVFYFCAQPMASAQLTVRVTAIPSNTPTGADIFIAGDFNTWNPGDATKKLTRQTDGTYSITFTPPTGAIAFKFTRGDWATVEGNASGGQLPNRTYTYSGGAQTLNVTILTWEGSSTSGSTAAANVRILSTNFAMPQLNGRTRRIWLYVPPDYTTNTTRRYPVLYMHDGQNLFDRATSFSGEWQVDEALNTLFGQGDRGAIVVGIDNGGTSRLDEYSPWRNTTYNAGGEGAAYTQFLVQTLKPYIDANFRTLTDRDNTAIAGSSMGGLISMYAAMQYPQVYSKVGIFSPAFWFAPECFTHAQTQGRRQPMRFYFVAGQNESTSMVSDMRRMTNILQSAGYVENQDYKLLAPADGAHSEWFWAREFPAAYQWLFRAAATPTTDLDLQNNTLSVYPNPADSILHLQLNENTTLEIVDMQGEILQTRTCTIGNHELNTQNFPSGQYVIKAKNKILKKFTVAH